MGSCNRYKGRVCAEEGEDISIIKRGKRRGEGVYQGVAKKGVYLTIQVTTDSTGIFHREEGR